MTQETYPLINLDVIRATLLDNCGAPAYGDAAQIATEGVVSVAVTANYDDGTEISVKNGKGKNCVKRDAEEELQNLSLTIVFCKVDPEFYTAVTGFPKIVNDAGVTIGYRTNVGVRPVDTRVALEGWSDAYATADCDGDETPYAYTAWPFLRGGRVSDYTLENNAVTFSVSGMKTQSGSQWGEGPYLVASDSLGAAQALFDAVDAEDHELRFKTTIAPPAETGGLVPLDDPDDADATTATAGTPGTWDGVRPFDLTELQASSITGSGGASPWTTGQYVILGDGTKAHWAGSGGTPKWVGGAA